MKEDPIQLGETRIIALVSKVSAGKATGFQYSILPNGTVRKRAVNVAVTKVEGKRGFRTASPSGKWKHVTNEQELELVAKTRKLPVQRLLEPGYKSPLDQQPKRRTPRRAMPR